MMQWESSDLVEWLHPYDAFFTTNLLVDSGGGICEIGVYKGGFLVNMLRNNPGLNALAIDPFPGLHTIKDTFLANLSFYGLEGNVKLFPNYSSLSENSFDLIHIDGDHSEGAVLQDLYFAQNNIGNTGLIVVDDIWHPLFPGVVSATMKFVHERPFVPFLSTRQKMYICRETQYEFYHIRALELLQKYEISYQSEWVKGQSNSRGDVAAYDQSSAIKGKPQLMIDNRSRYEQLVILKLVSQKSRLPRQILKELLPPFLLAGLKKLTKRV